MSTLSVIIYQNTAAYNSPSYGSTAFYIPAETCVHMFLRLPTQAGLPGVSATKATQTLVIDVGICTETISLTGTVNTVSSGSGDPAKTDLEAVSRTWWDYGAVLANLPIITLSTGQSYYGCLKSASFTQEGGTVDRWTFEIIFVVRAKL